MPPKETTTAMPDGEREKLVAAAAALVAKRAEQRAQLDKEQSRGSDVVAYTIAAVCFIALAVLLYLSIAPRPFLLPSELHGTWHVTQVDSTAVTDAVPFATNKRRTTFSSDDFDEDESPDVAALSAKTVGESKQAPVKLKYRFGATDVTTVTLNLTRYMDHDDVNDVLILASPKSTSADKKQDTTASSEAGDDAAPASAPTSSDLEPTYGDEVVVGESAGVVEMIPGFVALDLGRVPFTRQPMHAFSWTWSGPCYVPPSLADDGIASSSDEKVKVFVRADHKTCTVMYHLSRMVVSVFTTDPRVFDESEPGDMNTTSGGSIWVKTNEVSGKMDAPVVTYVLVSTVSRDMATDRKVKLVVMIVLIVVLLQLFLRSTKPGPNQRMAQEKLQLAQHRKRMEEARRTRAHSWALLRARAAQVTVKLSDALSNAQLAAKLTDPLTDELLITLDSTSATSWSSFSCHTLTLHSPVINNKKVDLTLSSVKVNQTVVIEGGKAGSSIALNQLEVGDPEFTNSASLAATGVDVQAAFAGQLRMSGGHIYSRTRGIVFAGTVGLTISAVAVHVVDQEGIAMHVMRMPSTTLFIADNTITATEHGVHIVGPNTAGDAVPNNVEIVGNTITIDKVKTSTSRTAPFASGITLGTDTKLMSGKILQAFSQTTIALLTSISRNTISITAADGVSCVGIAFSGTERSNAAIAALAFTAVNLTVNHNAVTILPPPTGGTMLTSEPNAIRVVGAFVVVFSLQYNRIETPLPLVFQESTSVKVDKRFRAIWVTFMTVTYDKQLALLGSAFVEAPAAISHNFMNISNISMSGDGKQGVNAVYLGDKVTLAKNTPDKMSAFMTGLDVIDNEFHSNAHHGQTKLFVYDDMMVKAPYFRATRNKLRATCLGCNVSYGFDLRTAFEIPKLILTENDVVTSASKLSVPLRLTAETYLGRDVTSYYSNYVIQDNVFLSNTTGPALLEGVIICGIQADGGMVNSNLTITGNTLISAGLGKAQAVGMILVPVNTSTVVITNNTFDERATTLSAAILFPALAYVESVTIQHNKAILVSGGGTSLVSFPTEFQHVGTFRIAHNDIRMIANPSGSVVVTVDTLNVSSVEVVDNKIVASVDTPDPSWCYHPRTKVGFAVFMSFDPGLSREYFDAEQKRMEDVRSILIARNAISVTTPCFAGLFASQYLLKEVSVAIESNTMRVRPPSWAGPVDCSSSFDACVGEQREETLQQNDQYLPMDEKLKRFDVLNMGLLLTPESRRINTTGAGIATVYGDVGKGNSINVRFNELSLISGAPLHSIASPEVISSSGSLMQHTEQDINTWVSVPSKERIASAKAAVRNQHAYVVDMAIFNFGMDNVLSTSKITGDRVGSALTDLPVVRGRMRGNKAYFAGGRSGTAVLFDGAPDRSYSGGVMPAHTAFMFGADITSHRDTVEVQATLAVAALVASLRSTNSTTHFAPQISDKCTFQFSNTKAVLETAGGQALIALAVGQQIGEVHIEDADVKGRFDILSPSSQPSPDANSPGQNNNGEHIAQLPGLTSAVVATTVVAPTFTHTAGTPAVPVSSATLEANEATMHVVFNRSSMNITSLVEDEAAARVVLHRLRDLPSRFQPNKVREGQTTDSGALRVRRLCNRGSWRYPCRPLREFGVRQGQLLCLPV